MVLIEERHVSFLTVCVHDKNRQERFVLECKISLLSSGLEFSIGRFCPYQQRMKIEWFELEGGMILSNQTVSRVIKVCKVATIWWVSDTITLRHTIQWNSKPHYYLKGFREHHIQSGKRLDALKNFSNGYILVISYPCTAKATQWSKNLVWANIWVYSLR